MDRYLAANRALWDEWTAIHARSAFYDLEGFKRGGVRLRPYEIEEVGDVAGKSLLHLQCHFGIDTLSWARLGARVTGADFSERAIEMARALAAELHLEARFVCSEVLKLPAVLDGEFDIVYTSRGVIPWLPDLRGWAEVIGRLVKPAGFFYITEHHPVTLVWDDRDDLRELRLAYPYFERTKPLEFPTKGKGSYADRDARVEQPVEYEWPHSLGEIISAVAGAGLRIDFLHEFPFSFYQGLPFLEPHEGDTWRLPAGWPGELPLSFSLKATKPVR